MNPQQQRGGMMLIALILGAVLFTVLGIAFHPDQQGQVSSRAVLFLILELAVFAGLFQGRVVPKFLSVAMLCGGVILGGRLLLAGELPLPLLVGTIVAALFFAAFAALLLFSKEIEAFLAFRRGESEATDNAANATKK